MSQCALCADPGGEVLFADDVLRVVAADEPLHPAFLRVVWQAHVREMTDLAARDRDRMMAAVFAAESALREALPLTKVNLASLGNVTPHLHWHVIARFADDPHFPAPVWSAARHARPVSLAPGWRETVGTRLRQLLGGAK